MTKNVFKVAPVFSKVTVGISILAMIVGAGMFMIGFLDMEDLLWVGPIVFGAGLLVLLDFIVAVYFYYAAMDKGYHELAYLYIPFILTIVGYLLVIALPDHGVRTTIADDELPEL